jgi:hypothetical protein
MAEKRKAPSHSHESATTGRVAELFLGSILLSNGFEVYQPLVDVAVDYLAFDSKPNRKRAELRFQCKRRSKPDASIFDLSLPKDKKASLLTHVFYTRGPADRADYWIIPFVTLKRYAKKRMGGNGRTVHRLYLNKETLVALRDYKNEYGLEKLCSGKE